MSFSLPLEGWQQISGSLDQKGSNYPYSSLPTATFPLKIKGYNDIIFSSALPVLLQWREGRCWVWECCFFLQSFLLGKCFQSPVFSLWLQPSLAVPYQPLASLLQSSWYPLGPSVLPFPLYRQIRDHSHWTESRLGSVITGNLKIRDKCRISVE